MREDPLPFAGPRVRAHANRASSCLCSVALRLPVTVTRLSDLFWTSTLLSWLGVGRPAVRDAICAVSQTVEASANELW